MVETDWREILSFSQKELTQSDKEKLCESLCWMEADDIELNFTDLKTLFRLSQDILKLKSEQVNNLLGQLKSTQRKTGKMKVESIHPVSPTQSNDSALETITHQEEIIRANKEILEQLYADIADLESRKSRLEESRSNFDMDSDSSRDVLSEMNAVAELEQEVAMKNKHIRKLLSDVKILEDENTKLKEKVSILKEKLTEATQLIDNLTEQMMSLNNECCQLKEILGKSERTKAQLTIEIEGYKKELFEKESTKDNAYEEIKSKIQHWKNVARSKKAEVEALSNENLKLKEDLKEASKVVTSPKKNGTEKQKIQELQEKLLEASAEMEQSANLINLLRAENKQLKAVIEEVPESSVTDAKNISDDGKERTIINKLKKKVKALTVSLQGAEEMIGIREKELTEITSQLQLLKSDEGINALIEGLKNKKRQLKFKDEGIKNLVQETNTLNQLINDLQLENEALRQKCNISSEENIPVKGIMKEYHELQKTNSLMVKELKKLENKLIGLELSNRDLNTKVLKMENLLNKAGYTKEKIQSIIENSESDDNAPKEEEKQEESKSTRGTNEEQPTAETEETRKEMLVLIEENKGLRNGLQEILNFLKDNSKTSSGILTLQCPSLESILMSMEAKYSAGWFAPHMTTVMELRAALGGKDALLTALHEARKETFEVMAQLTDATKKSSELEKKLKELEIQNKQKEMEEKRLQQNNADLCEFGSWMSDKEQNDIDFFDKTQVDKLVQKGNSLYEYQLKKGLEYFHMKFKELFDRLTSMAIKASDDLGKWTIQEEHYKAEIENLKSQLQIEDEDDFSDHSPGVIPIPNTNSLKRKCSYLEESYRYIRTLNENMKNEMLETKRQAMIAASEYESRIQKLLLSVTDLTDKLRNSISLELFWKQNEALNDVISKYRKLVEDGISSQHTMMDLLKRLEEDRLNIINYIRVEQNNQKDYEASKEALLKSQSNIEQMVLKKQLEQICSELELKNKQISVLEKQNVALQEAQVKNIDKSLAALTKEEVQLMEDRIQKLTEDNKLIKEQCQHVGSQLEIALLQLQDSQQRQMSNDMEINLLQHQVLDLQSASDNKAIIARLSAEILVAHLQASDSNKKIERLHAALNKEKELRVETEEMLNSRQRIFEVYALRYESKFRYLYEVMQTLRQQYQGSLPLTSIEKYLNRAEELARKNHAVDEKLSEIEDLRANLIAKHTVFDQILDVSKHKCLVDEDSCSHKLKYVMMQSVNSREIEHLNKKMRALELSREDMINQYNNLEKTLVLVNQGFEKATLDDFHKQKNNGYYDNQTDLELEDIQSDDESSSRKSQTVTLSKPQILKQQPVKIVPQKEKVNVAVSPIKIQQKYISEMKNAQLQTISIEISRKHEIVQTNETGADIDQLIKRIDNLKNENNEVTKQLYEAMSLAQKYTEEIIALNKVKVSSESNIRRLKDDNNEKDNVNERLRTTIEELRHQLNENLIKVAKESTQIRNIANEETNSLLSTLKQLENDKNAVLQECKELLNKEREEYAKTVKEMNSKLVEMQSKLDKQNSEATASEGEAVKEVVKKYTMKIGELEDQCFKLQNELDECKAELTTYQNEAERWKDLASERLSKMEQLNTQLEERHCHEVKSYKAENEHWLSQINEMQREHMELRTRLTEQKTIYLKQLSDKDTHIEQLRIVINNLKTQIMSMQTVISVNDPSFDLSAIVEVDEKSDGMSHAESDRLELKFESTGDLHDSHDDIRIPASSTTIWQEPVIERLRREKQLAGKQNAILRRQIKVLASRERRARLDAQNLKNQVFRISTTGNKVSTAETASLHNKIASLQAQLMSARRETHSSVALWDKWKRAQQAADRWQARHEEKCQEVTKLEASLSLAKSAITRLEREKRMLLARLNEVRHDSPLMAIEKQESECQEKSVRPIRQCACSDVPVSMQALLDRVQAQQRRIAALEVAEKGNEVLVSEYEKALAEVTSLKGQVLKLESTILEAQIRTPIKAAGDTHPEIDYWKSYCDMLKEENIQLTQKINSLETMPTTAHQHRVNDLEQTVLTLRGVINKLQAEQKSGSTYKKIDSRPNSSRSNYTEKGRTQLESHRIEIVNLKRTIHDKDLLLEKSKEMLKIAAEREDELLRENTYLRQLDDFMRPKGGFMSA